MDRIVESLQRYHPALRNVTPDNVHQYLALVNPHVIAREMQRDDSVLDNHIAQHFAGDLGAIVFSHFAGEREDSTNFFVLCDYFMDRAVITRHPSIRQVVLFDSTVDSRAYRLAELADCRVFELFVNAVVRDEKERCVRESKLQLVARERHVAVVDFSTDGWSDALLAQGFNADEPTLWMVGSRIAHHTTQRSMVLLAQIDALSAPNSQLFVDMCSGHEVELRKMELEDLARSPVKFKPGLGAFEMYGDDARVFSELAAWHVELLARRDAERQYYGSMWDPVKLGARCITEAKAACLGPWYIVRFTKNQAETDASV